MFFLIRCVFWLWVVFSTIFSQTTPDSPASRAPEASRRAIAAQPLGQTAQAWLGTAANQVASRCAAAPATCLAIASRLSQLATSQERATTDLPRLATPHDAAVPLPPRRPSLRALKDGSRLDKTARREYFMDQVHAEADF